MAEPVFDDSGKYLWFSASTDAGPQRTWFAMSNADVEVSNGLYLVVLAKDEVMHAHQFRKLLERTPPDEGVSTGPEFQYLRAMSLSQFFMGAEGLKKKCKEIEDKDDALGIAFELEKATLQYYNAMKEVLGGSDTLNTVIQAEKAHLTKVMRYIITDSKFRGLADEW